METWQLAKCQNNLYSRVYLYMWANQFHFQIFRSIIEQRFIRNNVIKPEILVFLLYFILLFSDDNLAEVCNAWTVHLQLQEMTHYIKMIYIWVVISTIITC